MSSRKARHHARGRARRPPSWRCMFERLEWRALLSGDSLWTLTANNPPHGSLRQGDLNFDGHTDVADLSAMMGALADLSGFKSRNGLSDYDIQIVADLNGDGQVNNADVGDLIGLLAGPAGFDSFDHVIFAG